MHTSLRLLLGVGALAAVGCTREPQEIRKGNPTNHGRFGRSVAVSGPTAVVGAYQEDDGEGAAYVLARSGAWGARARLKASDPSHAEFGDAVAIDGGTIAVAASSADQPGAFRAGAVYVFVNAGGSAWTEQAKLNPPFPQAWQAFGVSVAIDGNRIVVGSIDRDQGAAVDAGAVYVFERTGGTWGAPVMLSAPSPVSQDKFGSSVAVLGDSVFVSAGGRDVGGLSDAGAVYVYDRVPGGWTLAQTLTASDRQPDDVFGAHLAVGASGSTRRLLVAATGADLPLGLTNAGAAYLFASTSGGAFTQTHKLVASDASSNDGFGTALALDEDRALLGAHSATGPTGVPSGAAYLFDLAGAAPLEEAKLMPVDASAGGAFGTAVALGGTFALVGTTGETFAPSTVQAGTVRSFDIGSSGTWEESQRLTASGKDVSDLFGRGIALSADTLAVTSVDTVDVLRRDPGGWSLVQQLPQADPGTLNGVAIDGARLAFMGSRYDRDATHPVGYADVYSRAASGLWTLAQRIEPDLVSSSFPGESANSTVVALQGSRLVLGCPRWNGGDGRVFVYVETAGAFALSQTFDAPNAGTNFDINYGRALALDGDLLVVSEVPSAGFPGRPFEGRVFVYEAIGGIFALVQTLTAPVPVDGDAFGRGVALAGNLLAIVGERSGGSTILRTYRRTGGVFTETWNAAVSGVSTRADLALEGDALLLGASDGSYGTLTAAGEVLRYQREPSDTWVLAATHRAPRAQSSDHYGSTLAFHAGRLAAGAPRLGGPSAVFAD
jgi:hypothetical protein